MLRLPNHSYDSKDLVCNSIAGDGPEEIVDAEEYLQPQAPAPAQEGQLFSKGQRFPVNEDDYLTPKPSNPKAHIDLVDGKWNNMPTGTILNSLCIIASK